MRKPHLSVILGGRTLQGQMPFRAKAPKPKPKRPRSARNSVEVRGIPGRLADERERANLGVVELDAKAGLGQGTTSRIEAGERFPDIETIFRYAKALSLNLHWLITGEGKRYAEYDEPARAPTPATDRP